MEQIDTAVVEQLVFENPRFRKLYEEHVLFEKELQQLDNRPHLTPDDEIQRKKIQKLKLAGKDEMNKILAQVQ
ncbi:MAG: YdcH family protein [Desulfuromonadales bacterium]|nr:YdcH family protein [Desulfuromonadales bacterium]